MNNIPSSNILIVDDEPVIAESLEMILQEFNMNTTVFTCPVMALDKFRKNPGYFDLLLSDYNMPSLNGGKLAKFVKEISSIPVIILTGYSRAITEDLEFIDNVIEKPFDIEELVEKIQNQLQKNLVK